MASMSERMLNSFSMDTLSKATDLKKRLLFTLGALIVYRLGTYIPLPGIDPKALQHIFSQQSGGILGMFDLFTGGALSRMTIFALNIMPYISASIIMQLLVAIVPSLSELKKEGEAGETKINQYTRYGTVLLAFIQGYGIAFGLETLHSVGGGASAVIDPGLFFRVQTAISITAGTMFLMWLGEQITERGIGNGVSLIIFSGIVASLPGALAATLQMGRTGALSTIVILFLFVLVVCLVAFIVFMERAQRRVLIQYPKRQVGNKMFGGEASHLPLKLNTSGVIPPIFASSLLLLPITLANFNRGHQYHWLDTVTALLGQGQPLFLVLYVLLIIFFAFFYTSIVFNSEETADNLKKNGGFIPGIRPGQNTASYLDYLLTRLTVLGALYLAFVCVLPQILISEYSVPFRVGGTGLLIVVAVTLDTVVQIQSHLFAHQYEALIKKSPMQRKKSSKGKRK